MNTQLLIQQEKNFPFISVRISYFHTKEEHFLPRQENPN